MSTETDFDIIAFLEGSNYPEKTVKLYTDGKSATELRELLEQENPDSKKVEALRTKINSTAITFTLRGLAPKVVEVMMRKADVNSKDLTEEQRVERFIESTDSLTAATIQKVETADGKVDPRTWDSERAASLRGALISSEYEKLSEAVAQVNFDGKLFAESVDAGFPLGRSE